MQGATHRLGGVNAALGGYIILHHQGLTIPDVNPLLQLAVVYPFAMYGSTASDLDHHWGSVPSRDVVSRVFHTVLHASNKTRLRMYRNKAMRKSTAYWLLGIFDAKHRSWQTHSDFSIVALMGLLWYVCFSPWSVFHGTDNVIVSLILTGLILGLIAHIILDGITPEGIWCAPAMLINHMTGSKNLPEKYKIVPNRHYFATGNGWEKQIIFRLLTVTSFLMMFYIIYLALPWRLSFNFN